MSGTSKPFFQDPAFQEVLRRFDRELDAIPDSMNVPPGLTGCLSTLVRFLVGSSQEFDQYSVTNITWVGKRLRSEVQQFGSSDPEEKNEKLQIIFALCYRVACEFQIFVRGDPAMEFDELNRWVGERVNEFRPEIGRQLVYAQYSMPAQIIRTLVRTDEFASFRNFDEQIKTAQALKIDWDKDIEEKRKNVEELSSHLAKIASEYNFVLLVDAFKSLRQKKDKEAKIPFFAAVALAIGMLLLPIIHYMAILTHMDFVKQNIPVLLYTLPAVLAAEILVVYLFRVVLSQFRSVKAQLLQLDLRIALCQFVESYADYVGKIRKNDTSLLAKFEALIFSGLVTDQNDIPSTFDGVEQIAALVKSIQSKT